jgi:hypothetical protein
MINSQKIINKILKDKTSKNFGQNYEMKYGKYYLISKRKCPECNTPYIKAKTGGEYTCLNCNRPMRGA